ncbi:MAG: twin-arginine translocation signal domain-containing protein [Planctomycetota bacterium]|jgi:hypothetical protein
MESKTDRKTDRVSRRDFIKTSGVAGAATLLSGTNRVFAAGSSKIRLGLIGDGRPFQRPRG